MEINDRPEQSGRIRYFGCDLFPGVIERFEDFIARDNGNRDNPDGVRG